MAAPIAPSSCFFLLVHRLESDVVVAASGALDLAATPTIAELFTEYATSACRRVVVDMSAVTFADISGLRALLTPPMWRATHLEIVVRSPSPAVRRVLELADWARLIERSTIESAGDQHASSSSTRPPTERG